MIRDILPLELENVTITAIQGGISTTRTVGESLLGEWTEFVSLARYSSSTYMLTGTVTLPSAGDLAAE